MRSTGNQFEQLACNELERHGLALLQRNYYCRYGELDLIMRHNDTVVFVEVRYRQHAGHGDALASINLAKRNKLILAAQSWLAAHPKQANHPCRFDIMAFDGPAERMEKHWYRNVFDTGS